ncbi:hypothetical protein GCM10023069_08660 [Shinella granuli]
MPRRCRIADPAGDIARTENLQPEHGPVLPTGRFGKIDDEIVPVTARRRHRGGKMRKRGTEKTTFDRHDAIERMTGGSCPCHGLDGNIMALCLKTRDELAVPAPRRLLMGKEKDFSQRQIFFM